MTELIQLEIEGFGKFDKKKTIDFKKGVNFITGLNETGKSTILEAILASLFRYTNTKIQPLFCWTNRDICKLVLTYKTDAGDVFKIISDYKNSKKKLVKITENEQSEISTKNNTIQQYIKEHFGFTEQKVFENTTFIRQSQMAILSDNTTKNKLRDMIEEVFVGSAEASATKSLIKIKKVVKASKKDAENLRSPLEELKYEFSAAEDYKSELARDLKKYESIREEFKEKFDRLEKLKDNKKLFEEKGVLLKNYKDKDIDIEQNDEIIETLEKQTVITEQSKTMPIVLIIGGVLLSLTLYGAIVGIPLILYGIYQLFLKPEKSPKVQSNISEKIEKYKKQKKYLINEKAVIESKLEKYELVNFSLDDFRDIETLDEEVEKLKTNEIELKISISTTRQFVKSPEELKEEIDTIGNQIKELLEKSKEHELAATFLEKAETEVQHKFTPSIEKNSICILKKVTDNKYSDLKINEDDLSVYVKAPEINEYVPVDILSQGTKDQIYFTIRTTMTDLLSGNVNVPLIIDDPFHNFDDARLGKTISAVKELANEKQTILISHKNYQKDYVDFADNIIEV